MEENSDLVQCSFNIQEGQKVTGKTQYYQDAQKVRSESPSGEDVDTAKKAKGRKRRQRRRKKKAKAEDDEMCCDEGISQ